MLLAQGSVASSSVATGSVLGTRTSSAGHNLPYSSSLQALGSSNRRAEANRLKALHCGSWIAEVGAPRQPRRVLCLGKGSRQSRPGQGGDFDRERGKNKDKDIPQPYLIQVVTPPPRDLGLHCLPQNTQCGETIDIEGENFIVSGVTYRYRLAKGKYVPGEKRLDVQSTGRYLVNLYLDELLHKS